MCIYRRACIYRGARVNNYDGARLYNYIDVRAQIYAINAINEINAINAINAIDAINVFICINVSRSLYIYIYMLVLPTIL